MHADEPCKIGYLFSSPQKTFLKKSWIKRFYALYKASNHGIQRLEVFDNENNFLKQSPPLKIITLTDCIKVTAAPQKQQSNVFEVRTKSHSYLFSADTFQEMTEWLSGLQNIAFGANQGTSDGGSSRSLENISNEQNIHHEENMLYSSVDGPEVYSVKVTESEATIRCNLQGTYNLVLTSIGISLTGSSVAPGKPLFTWSYRHIRRYGFGSDSFFFEAGRKSPSGEGLFKLETKDGAIIFQSIATLANQLKSSKSENNLTSSSPANEQKMFFFPACTSSSTQENGSPTSPGRKQSDSDGKSTDEDSSYASIKPRTQVTKPPRRSKMKPDNLYSNLQQTKSDPPDYNVYEDPSDIKNTIPQREPLYDEPLELQDAWRTHGRDVEDNYVNAADSDTLPLYEDVSNEGGCSGDNEVLADSLDKISIAKRQGDNDNGYDRLKFKHSKSLNNNGDHVYGKLLSKGSDTGPKACLLDHGNEKSSSDPVVRSSSTPGYANVIISSSKVSFRKDSIGDNATPHFTANDAVYAQIIKKKEKK